jgi:hypothetical protein
MQSNAILNTLPNAERLKVAHSALHKATSKKEICLEDFDDYGDEISVTYFNEHTGDFVIDETIQRYALVDFILEFYSSTVDEFFNGRHIQYEHPVSASDYLDENMQSVLKDYLNNRK